MVKPLTASLKVNVWRSGFTDVEGGVVDGDAGGWADCVDGVVAGIQTAAARVARQIIHAGVIQAQHIRSVGSAGAGGKRCRPGEAAIAAR